MADASGRSRKRKAERPASPVAKRGAKVASAINEVPAERLKVFVFGEGGNGELGLGAKGNIIDVKRPRLNPFLLPEQVGVVHVATGGMHAAALTHDNRILTWGVNDQGALGRDTMAGEQLRDMDDTGSDAGSDTGLNPLEAEPGQADQANVPSGTVWARLACGDGVTFAITTTGQVFGCGTFRSNEGILGFSREGEIAPQLVQVAGLRDVVDIACGAEHALALDRQGRVFAWGSGQQSQLGRRIVERTRVHGLRPTPVAFPRAKIVAIGSGNYHSFAVDNRGEVWAWGLNSFGETGLPDHVGQAEAVIVRPTKVPALSGKGVVAVAGGSHHSLARTETGELLAFGRCDGSQSGLNVAQLAATTPAAVLSDNSGRPRLIRIPQTVPGLLEDASSRACAAGTDSNISVGANGRAYSWGFSANYQTGQGTTDDVPCPRLVDNTATREERLVWAGAGGQFGMLASVARI
jgi:regulator of chromosome condensation